MLFGSIHVETKIFKTMRKIYIVPEMTAYDVVAERGYEVSTSFGLPGFEAEEPDTWA